MKSDTKIATAVEPNRPARTYFPKLAFYHPNGAGNGSALQLELRLNRKDENNYDCFFLELACQKSVANRNGDKMVPASFDWEKKLTAKLSFTDICEFLTVFEGKAERIGGQRNGLYHQNGVSSTVISLQRNTEKGGFFVGLSKKDKEGGNVARIHFTLSEAEAIGIRSVLTTALFLLAFHRSIFAAAQGYAADLNVN